MQVPINCHCESFVRIKKQIITLSFSTFAAFGAHIPHEYLIDKQNPFEALIIVQRQNQNTKGVPLEYFENHVPHKYH